MGIQGLMSYCIQNHEQCVEYVDLVQEANSRGGIQILVDFYSFEHFVLRNFWRSLSIGRENEFLRIDGGEYKSLDQYLSKLVQDLRSLDIELVFYIDGAKGSSRAASNHKLETWKYRHHRDVHKLQDLLEVCYCKKKMEEIPDSTSVRPVLLEVQVIETLKENGCKVIQCPSGEADYKLAIDLHNQPKAYAVLTNDSDFSIIRDCVFIPYDLFDLNNDLQLAQAQVLPENPIRLSVGTISSQKVQDLFGFRSHRLLIDFCIVAGNDFTSHFMKTGLRDQIDIRGNTSNLNNIAGWMRHYKAIENHPVLAREMQYSPQFAEAVHHSRQFYSLTMAPEQLSYKCQMTKQIEERITNGDFPSNIMAMHNNFYWHRMLLEEAAKGHPCIEHQLKSLRAWVYSMVLPRGEHMVVEYGRSPFQTMASSGVYAVDDPHLPKINIIQPEKVFPSLRQFHKIMTHQEPEFGHNFFERYGRKTGFICYILRYFVVLNDSANLHITLDEFLSLFATAFGYAYLDDEFYQTVPMLPTSRCVTMGNWFQDVYRHAFYFLGKLLYLSHEFPTPKEFFSGARWTAFYTYANPQDLQFSPRPIHPACLQRIEADRYKIISEKRHMIRYLVEGVFDFDDRRW